MTGAPMLKAAGLWLKTSAKGNPYLVGRLGGVKILILQNLARGGENEPTHQLFFVDGEASRRVDYDPETSRQPARRRPYAAARRTIEAGPDVPSDRVDDLYQGGAP